MHNIPAVAKEPSPERAEGIPTIEVGPRREQVATFELQDVGHKTERIPIEDLKEVAITINGASGPQIVIVENDARTIFANIKRGGYADKHIATQRYVVASSSVGTGQVQLIDVNSEEALSVSGDRVRLRTEREPVIATCIVGYESDKDGSFLTVKSLQKGSVQVKATHRAPEHPMSIAEALEKRSERPQSASPSTDLNGIRGNHNTLPPPYSDSDVMQRYEQEGPATEVLTNETFIMQKGQQRDNIAFGPNTTVTFDIGNDPRYGTNIVFKPQTRESWVTTTTPDGTKHTQHKQIPVDSWTIPQRVTIGRQSTCDITVTGDGVMVSRDHMDLTIKSGDDNSNKSFLTLRQNGRNNTRVKVEHN